MTNEEQRATLAIVLMAAFADGRNDDRERDALRKTAATLSNGTTNIDFAGLHQEVLLKRISVDNASALLKDVGLRQLAYELAVSMCEADGQITEPERAFLDVLSRGLNLDNQGATGIEQRVEEFTAAGPVTTAAASPQPSNPPSAAELDRSILNYALLNGALELLPQSWASMAIIPLQIKMVHGIGKSHGYALDQGHIKEFIAAAGVGLTSQYLEQIGRKLIGGLLGKAAGKTFGNLGGAATGMAFSFATTYALGQVAKRYYAGGRTMTGDVLRDTFNSLIGPARTLQSQYLPQIQNKAGSLDAAQVMALVRGA